MAVDGVLSVALAPVCAACRCVLEMPTAGPVCDACWDAVARPVPPLCLTCGDPLASWRVLAVEEGRCPRCRRVPPAFDAARAAGAYEGSLREIVHAFKYESRRSLAAPLAAMMRNRCADLLDGAELAVPVPLHRWRRLRRGFNQADELASRLDLPVARVLRRTRATRAQAGLRPAERRRNMRRAFELAWFARPADVRDRCVVLVDDVRTTGATLDACERVLKDDGAAEVRAVTAAQAAPRSGGAAL